MSVGWGLSARLYKRLIAGGRMVVAEQNGALVANAKASQMGNSRFWAYIEDMRRDDVIARLKQAEPMLRAFGVDALYLFGSHARDEAEPDSDIDVFIDPAPGFDFGFLPFMDAYETIQKAVGENVDYGTRTGLHPLLRHDIEREAIRVF